jgi:hypothetical protein
VLFNDAFSIVASSENKLLSELSRKMVTPLAQEFFDNASSLLASTVKFR